ncbi:MAG: hypothetical protein ACREJQ_03210, partial [bacterium]
MLGILVVVLLVFAVRTAIQKSGGKMFYEDPPKVELADKADHPEVLHVFLDTQTPADAGIKEKQLTITEGEMNAFLKAGMEKTDSSKPEMDGVLTLLMDFKDNSLDIYFGVEPGKVSKGLDWFRISYLTSYGLQKEAAPLSLELRVVRMGSTPVPLSQWKAQTAQSYETLQRHSVE